MSLADRVDELEKQVKYLMQFVGVTNCKVVSEDLEEDEEAIDEDEQPQVREQYMIVSKPAKRGKFYYAKYNEEQNEDLSDVGWEWTKNSKEAFMFTSRKAAGVVMYNKLHELPLASYREPEIVTVSGDDE